MPRVWRVPHPPLHASRPGYKACTCRTKCTIHPHGGWPTPKVTPDPPWPDTWLFPHLEPPHINRNDHQTGQTNTWILPPPPEASRR